MAGRRITQTQAPSTVPKPTPAVRREGPRALVTHNLESAERQLGVGAGKPGFPHCVELCERPFFKGWTQGLARQWEQKGGQL
jgi:hypothetical protein